MHVVRELHPRKPRRDLAPPKVPELVGRTAHFRLVQCFGAPNACLIPTLGIQNIAYRDMHGHMHVVSRDPDGITTTRDLTLAADVPIGISNPFGYTDPTTN